MSLETMKYIEKLFKFLEPHVPTSRKNALFDALCSLMCAN